MRPRLLDLFCGAGGCSVGYHRAGFDVVGVDIKPQPRYPFEFHQADAMTYPLDAFDVVHASPPCHDHSRLSAIPGRTHGTGWMLDAIRARLIDWGGDYVMENVVGAPLRSPLQLCGSEFDLKAVDRDDQVVRLQRHRLFESNLPLLGAGGCSHPSNVQVAGVYGHASSRDRAVIARTAYVPSVQVRAALMGIDWMTGAELSQAIPPAYTEFIGAQLVDHLRAVA